MSYTLKFFIGCSIYVCSYSTPSCSSPSFSSPANSSHPSTQPSRSICLWWNECQLFGWVMLAVVGVDDSSLQANTQLEMLWGPPLGTWRCSTFTGWTLKMRTSIINIVLGISNIFYYTQCRRNPEWPAPHKGQEFSLNFLTTFLLVTLQLVHLC